MLGLRGVLFMLPGLDMGRSSAQGLIRGPEMLFEGGGDIYLASG